MRGRAGDRRGRKEGGAGWIRRSGTPYIRAYNQRPHVKEKRREYRRRPEIKARDNERAKEYQRRPEVKARMKEYLKEYRKTYYQRPEVKARKKEYRKAYYQRPEVKAKAAARYKKKKIEKMIALLQAEGYTVKKGVE